MAHPSSRENRATIRLLAISVIFLVILVALLAVILTIRHNDLAQIEKRAAAAAAAHDATDQEHDQAFCELLLTYKAAPPTTAFGKEIAIRAGDLAKRLECPGA